MKRLLIAAVWIASAAIFQPASVSAQAVVQGSTLTVTCLNAGATKQIFGAIGTTQYVRLSATSEDAFFQWNTATCAAASGGAPIYVRTYQDVLVPSFIPPNDAGVPAATFCCNSAGGTAVAEITPIGLLR